MTYPNLVFRYSKKPSQNKRFVCKHRAVSLSLSLSLSLALLLRPAIKVCKQFRFRRSYDVLDQGHTSIPRVIIISSDFASDDHGTFQTNTSFKMHAMGGSRGGQGVWIPPPPPEKSQNIGVPSNIDPDPLKNSNGGPLTRQQNAISKAFC